MTEKYLQVAVGVIKNATGQILIALRDPDLPQGGVWEFPGGKLETGETARQALARELQEELGITVQMSTPLIAVRHHYPGLAVQLHVFEVTGFSGMACGNQGQPIQWVEPWALADYAFPEANRPIIAAAQLPTYYAVLEADGWTCTPDSLQGNLQKILGHGVKLIQVRLKGLLPSLVEDFIGQAHPLCRQAGACLLANSALDMSAHPAFQGLHLTSHDLLALKRRPSHLRWLAASCHSLDELRHAEAIGADFAVLGPVLPTLSHPHAKALGWAQFADWVAAVNMPVYALGGMALPMLPNAREAGAQGIASIRAFLD